MLSNISISNFGLLIKLGTGSIRRHKPQKMSAVNFSEEDKINEHLETLSSSIQPMILLGCQTSDSASSSEFYHLALLVVLVSHSSNFHHWLLLALFVA